MNAYLFPGLEFGPRIVEGLVAQIPAGRYNEKTNPDRFTLREAVAHLADWEPILRSRIAKAIAEPEASIQGIDEGLRAEEMGYKDLDVKVQLVTFATERGITIAYLRSLAAEDWSKAITHNEKGRQTVSDQANQLLGHDLYHIDHLMEFFHEKVAGTW
ncbi:MAG: DinB family protein [Chlorobia bacterium]|nr:DinB family protein [Fimbriimonadaceae bacterium]